MPACIRTCRHSGVVRRSGSFSLCTSSTDVDAAADDEEARAGPSDVRGKAEGTEATAAAGLCLVASVGRKEKKSLHTLELCFEAPAEGS